ncbi:MAG: thioredoxin domain-containing protein [Deltaproteobacteria bacterium]|nr:thioredoxin domain-containing protein [Deltaproteobacteria bacterium]
MSNPSRPANRLARETSAYLRQHMHNPVDWFPWGEEALAKARAEDKPLLVSIGYSACHWCHVMERESFEDDAIASLMNQWFVPVKVDREERPDVDQIYMDTVMRLQGHGGWPLTVFCKPDGAPFYAGTYFPPEPRHGLPSFRQVLEGLHRAYHQQRDKVDETARQVLASLRDRARGVASAPPGAEQLVAAARRTMQGADAEHGGFGGGPKFPTPSNLDLLMAAAPLLPAAERDAVLAHLRHTALEMSRRGLYDQLAGGFHRYCVDGNWGVPHFEKMLYDQGQLMRFYADLWRQTGCGDEDLWWPIVETAAWLRREMRAPDGGCYASQDADSEGVEGKFYVWTPAEVSAVLGAERAREFCAAYAVSEHGNFEHANVLWDVARGPRENFAPERAELLAARAKRIPPATDTKRLLGWNALTISGLAYAGSLVRDETMRDDAVALADFCVARLRAPSGRWLRVFAEGTAKVDAFLDDLAPWLAALLDLYRAGCGERWLALALEVAEEIRARFFDPEENDLFFTPVDGERLVHRPRSDHDGATPHSAGLAVVGLLRAATLSGRSELRATAERVLRTHAFSLERASYALPTLARAGAWAERGLDVAVVIGDAADPRTTALAVAARRALGPEDAVLVAAPSEASARLDPTWLAGKSLLNGAPAAYVCRGVECSLPVTEPAAVAALVSPHSR